MNSIKITVDFGDRFVELWVPDHKVQETIANLVESTHANFVRVH